MAENMVIVHDLEGNQFEVSRANAIDLTRMGTYIWGPFNKEAAAAVAALNGSTAIPEDVVAPAPQEPAFVSVDDKTKTLEELANTVAGQTVEAFLEGMNAEQLRILSFSRYGEAIHHRVSKPTSIEKILAFEKELFTE